jgi:wobble nucleotide-excising tRNase
MENFNHHDGTALNGLGRFTIFDLENGAAYASLEEFIKKYENIFS